MDTITKEHELAQSQNIVADNLEKLKQLFPTVFTEGKVDFDALRSVLGDYVENENERYQFTWKGKAQALREAHKTSTGTLRPCPEESVNWDTTQNLYIEGDNLEVLKLLQKSYHGRVKMIYIDPPYNTGKDFVYKDSYKDNLTNYLELTQQGKTFGTNSELSGRYHSNWLNMMYPRLKISRNLIGDTGVIAIHIDEHEAHNLELILNEIFGEDNKLGTIIWDKKNPKGDSKGVSYQHETILLYAKNKVRLLENFAIKKAKENANLILSKAKKAYSKLGKKLCPSDLEKVVKKYNLDIPTESFEIVYTLGLINEEFNEWIKNADLTGGERAYSFIDEAGDVYQPVTMAWPNKDNGPDDYYEPILHPVTKKVCVMPDKGWRYPSKTIKELVQDGLIIYGKDETTQPRRKYFLKENMYENLPSVIRFGGSDDKLFKELELAFDNPKPKDFIKKIIDVFLDKDDIVVDFFSGSATTAHSTLEINLQDSGSRKFILVQVPELTNKSSEAYKKGFLTVAEIGKERVRRVINKIIEEKPDKVKEIDLGFKIFKLDSSNIKEWDPSTEDIQKTLYDSINNLKAERTEADILYEILLKYGLDLTLPIQEYQIAGNIVFSIGHGALLVCLSTNISKETIGGIGELKEDLLPEVCRVVLRDNGFKDDVAKTNAMQVLKRYGIEDVKSI